MTEDTLTEEQRDLVERLRKLRTAENAVEFGRWVDDWATWLTACGTRMRLKKPKP